MLDQWPLYRPATRARHAPRTPQVPAKLPEYYSLTELDFGFNKIIELEDTMFDELPTLTTLNFEVPPTHPP